MKFEFAATERNILLDFGVEVTQSDVRLRESSSSAVLDLISQTMDIDFRIAQRDGRHVISAEMGFFPSISYVVNENGAVNIIIEGLTGTHTINDLVTLTLLDARLLELADALSTVGASLWLPKSAGIAHPLTGDLYRSIDGTPYKAISAVGTLLGIGDDRIGTLMIGDIYIDQVEAIPTMQSVVEETDSDSDSDDEEEEEDEEVAPVETRTTRRNITELLQHLFIENMGTAAEPVWMLRRDLPMYSAVGLIGDGPLARGEIDETLFYRLDRWEEYVSDSDQDEWLMSARLGVELENRITVLENLDITTAEWGDDGEDYYTLTVNGVTKFLKPYGDDSALRALLEMFQKIEYPEGGLAQGQQGIKALLDLFIIQTAADSTTNPATAEVLKNVSAILRHISLANTANAPIAFDRGITSSSYITAGALNPSSQTPSGDVLYIFDSWDQTLNTGWEEWAFSAGLAYALRSRISTLEMAVSAIVDGGGGSSDVDFVVASGNTEYGVLTTGNNSYNLSLASHTHSGYLLASVFNNLFSVTKDNNDVVTLITALYPFAVTGALSATGNISTEGNVDATGNLSGVNVAASGHITAASYITAGAATGGSLGNVLYRLDSWTGYDPTTHAEWVPAAPIVASRLSAIEAAIQNISGGSDVEWGTGLANEYVTLTVENVTKSISLSSHSHSNYLLAQTFNNLFSVTKDNNDVVTLITALYPFAVTGALSATGNISTEGNVDATGNLSGVNVAASGHITAASYITAGASTGGSLGNVLYRLDTWVGYSDASYGDYVPSAALVSALMSRVSTLETAVGNISGGTFVTTTLSGGLTIVFCTQSYYNSITPDNNTLYAIYA